MGRIACWIGVTYLIAAAALGTAQMAPKAVAVIRNDSGSAMTIESFVNDAWQAVPIAAGKDASVSCARVRVATDRKDGARIIVDFPVSGGNKYRLSWNKSAGMWDFTEVK